MSKSKDGTERKCIGMSFYEYMISKYRYKDTPDGDLARDMERDNKLTGFFSNLHECSVEHQHESIEAHLFNLHACSEALYAFERCWKKYKRYVKREGKKNEKI